jgi:membrane associated rhomboid family serine protease
MGVYDRDYYRDDAPPERTGLFGGHSATVVLIALNVAVFLLWLMANASSSRWFFEFMAANFMISVEALTGFRAWTLVTYAFSHIDIWHILFNMLFLWVFGRLVEERYGPRNLTFLYLVAGIAAAVLYLAVEVGRQVDIPMLGASGSVMGLTVVAAFLHPNLPLYIWGILPIKLKWLAILFIVIDVAGMANQGGDPVAHSAHLGGALMGFLFYKFDLRIFDRPERTDFLQRLRDLFRRRPVLRVVPRPVRREGSAVTSPKPDSDTTERVDALLAKIHREGMGALSEEEKQFLETASQKYRK